MGGARAGRVRSGSQDSEEDLGFQDDVFPWFHIVQWCSEDAEDQSVFRWDLLGIKEAADALTQDVDTFLRKCPEQLPGNSGFTMDDDTVFAEWAAALLEWSAALRHVRYRLVPARRCEDVFWSRYFAGLRAAVRDNVFGEPSEVPKEEVD